MILKQLLKFSFLLFFNLLISEQALSYEKNLQALSQSFYDSVDSFYLKDTGFLKKDSEYYISALAPRLHLITSEKFTDFLEIWFEYSKRVDYQLSQVFELQPYFRKNYLMFSSPRRQIANASAAVFPFPFVHIYPSGSTFSMDLLSLSSWTQDTLLHEMAHIYQLAQNSKLDRVLWPFLTSFSHRNMLLPSWILEGDAVLLESLYGPGGRLFSGFVRAFVFSQIKEISLKRLLKPYDNSFSNLEKYLHGAYFFSYLHSQYGLVKIKKFFFTSGRFIPLDFYGLNQAVAKVFKKSLITLFHEYKAFYKDLAQKQKISSAPVLAKSKVYSPLNSDQNSIYFLISDSKSPAELVVFNKKTGAVTKNKKNIPIGKVFKRDGKYYSSASIRTSSSSIEYSLVKENFKPIKKYHSQEISDFYKDKAIAIDMRQNHTGNSLIIDKVFYSSVDSSVLTDSKGSLYYFKQEGKYRVLYQNKKALVKFQSYFAYPVEVSAKEVFFIGATKYGSSLFVYKKGAGIYRLSPSDTIVSARKLKDNRFLVSEITPSHFEYKVIETHENPERPFLYQYSFQKKNIFTQLKKPEEDLKTENLYQQKTLETGLAQKSLKPYKALSQLSLEMFAFLYQPVRRENKQTNHSFYSFAQFSDPLQHNQFLISNAWGKTHKSINTLYFYRKYRPSFELSFLYDERRLSGKKDMFLIETYKELGFLETEDIELPLDQSKRDSHFQRSWNMALSVSYPFYINSESNLKLKAQIGAGKKEFNKSNVWKDYISHSGKLEYQFKRKYFQAYSYHKMKKLSLKYNFLSLNSNRRFLNGIGSASLIEELGREYFLSLSGKAFINLWNREPKSIQVKDRVVVSCFILQLAAQGLYQDKYSCSNKNKQSIKNLYQGSIELLKVLNYSYYPLKIPFSVRRLAPLAGLAFFSAQNFNTAHRSFLVPYVGLEGDMNFLHEKLILKIGLALESRIEISKADKDSKLQLSFWLKKSL